MKKLFLSALLLAVTTLAWAEEPADEKRLTLIPKLGVNYSTTSLDSWVSKGVIDKPDVFGLVGPVGGLELEYSLKKKFSLSAALLYSMQGRKYDDLDSHLAAKNEGKIRDMIDATISTQRHHYINLPITANYYVAEGLSLRLGVQIGCLVYKSGRQEWPYDHTYDSNPKRSIGNSPMKFDVGIPVGLSYALKNGLQFDLRYIHGLTKISSSSGIIEEKNRVAQFTVGYRLDILK